MNHDFIFPSRPKSQTSDFHLDFSKIYLSSYSQLVRFATVFVVYEEDAENIIQDLFLGLWERKETLSGVNNLNAYLYKLAKNKCLDHLKHKMVKEKFVSNTQSLYEQEISLKLQSLESFDVELATEEKVEKVVSKAINSLPPKCREIFILSRHDGLKYKEISEKLNISVNTVETQMCIALKKLRSNLSYFFN